MIRRIDQVHAENAYSFLLLHITGIPQIHVQNYVVRRSVRLSQETQSCPSMTIVRSRIITGRNRIDEREKLCISSTAGLQLSQQLLPLAIEHGQKTGFRDVAGPHSVEMVAHFLVIGRDRFRYGSRGAAHSQKPASHLLSRTDFRE